MSSQDVGIGLSFEERLRISLSVELEQDGGSPSHFLDLLARAVEEEVWTKLGIEDFASFIEMPKPDGLGTSRKNLMTLLQLNHRDEGKSREVEKRLTAMRQRVNELLTPELGESDTPGPGRGNKNNDGPSLFYDSGQDTTYIKARLKRDNPDLARAVFANELSPHAAGIQAGFIQRRAKFVVGDVEQTARQLKKYFTPDQIDELIDLLSE